jgi:hypothetical protein
LANGGSILAIPPISRFPDCFALTGKKAKKGEKHEGKSAPRQNSKIGGKMKRKKTKRKQQGCNVAKVIDTVEQAVSTAKKVYRVIEPVVNALTNRRKTK